MADQCFLSLHMDKVEFKRDVQTNFLPKHGMFQSLYLDISQRKIMSNDTKATLSILVVVIVVILIASAYQYVDFMVKKRESLIESFNNNEEIYCSNDSKWMLISKSQDWKLVGYHFIKDDIAFDFGNCEKNTKVATNVNPKRN